jgi:hypothetical protein
VIQAATCLGLCSATRYFMLAWLVFSRPTRNQPLNVVACMLFYETIESFVDIVSLGEKTRVKNRSVRGKSPTGDRVSQDTFIKYATRKRSDVAAWFHTFNPQSTLRTSHSQIERLGSHNTAVGHCGDMLVCWSIRLLLQYPHCVS